MRITQFFWMYSNPSLHNNFTNKIKKKGRDERRDHFDQLARMFITDMETEWAALMNKASEDTILFTGICPHDIMIARG